nr:MAG TPA: hypothetical protein [Caudoviricetes sp.]
MSKVQRLSGDRVHIQVFGIWKWCAPSMGEDIV